MLCIRYEKKCKSYVASAYIARITTNSVATVFMDNKLPERDAIYIYIRIRLRGKEKTLIS